LVQKSVTLNGIVAAIFVISAKSLKFGAHWVKAVEDIPNLSATEIQSKACSF